MEIQIKGIDETSHRYNMEHIAQLFFDEVQINFRANTEAKITIVFAVEWIEEYVSVKGILTDQLGQTYTETVRRLRTEIDFPEKKAVNYVYVKLLEKYTKMEQPWGMLVGIRPTKLVHQMIKKGFSKQEIRDRLSNIYLVSLEKIDLLERIVDLQLKVVPDLYSVHNEVSLYIGIPFCPTKCAYCTFPAYAIRGQKQLVDTFLQGLHYEIEQTGQWLKKQGIQVTTIYFGGGTPTSISASEMDALYQHLFQHIPNIDKVREITVEAGRPDTITEEKLDVLKKWKIDRISINPQSFENETLKAIGRHHTVEETIEKYRLARKFGMNNINMDLIIGLPGEGIKHLEHSLKETEKLMPESLTVHTLSFKRASTMTKQKDKYQVADREEITKMMEMASQWTREHQYQPYYLYRQKNILGNLENVGYALENKESIYNIMIMEEAQTIIGLGCGAASKFVDPMTGKITRFANAKDPHMYNQQFKYYTSEKIKRLDQIFAKFTHEW